MNKWIYTLSLVTAVFLLSAARYSTSPAPNLCHLSVKNGKLAMDQRDDVRLKCLQQKKSSINVAQCLSISRSMEYSINAEEARLLCLYDLRKLPTLSECVSITKAMEYPDSGDEARWQCLRSFNKKLTAKQCGSLAKAMSYPANTHRAQIFCTQERE